MSAHHLLRLLAMCAGLVTTGCASMRPAATNPDEPPLNRVRTEVSRRFETLEAPGAVFGIYRGAETEPALFLPLGYADERHTRPIRREDHFRIASLTKTFVGQVVLQLVDEGKLELDDPVSKYLPNVVPNGENITIAMLGYHTSGVPREMANPELQKALQAEPGRQWKAEEVLAYTWSMKPLFPPGKGWMYSNSNTIVLGEVIRAVTGEPWYEVVTERIVKPLGLSQTGYPQQSRVPEPTPRGYRFGQKDNLARYGDYWFDSTDWSGSVWGASGDMYSTMDDVAKFMRAAARGELVGPAGREAAFKWVDTGYENIEYGFHIARRDGGIGNTGDIPGFSSFAMYLPKHDLTIVCLANLTATPAKLTAAAELGELAVRLLGP
ncbi:MAG: beta-lactamase family protein [Phycisphaerales bacterium]|nr:beta-lactamase family protein [Phycisphaerales bacterium]